MLYQITQMLKSNILDMLETCSKVRQIQVSLKYVSYGYKCCEYVSFNN